MLSIVEETRNNAQKRGFRKLGLLAQDSLWIGFFQEAIWRQRNGSHHSRKEDQELIHHRLFSESNWEL